MLNPLTNLPDEKKVLLEQLSKQIDEVHATVRAVVGPEETCEIVLTCRRTVPAGNQSTFIVSALPMEVSAQILWLTLANLQMLMHNSTMKAVAEAEAMMNAETPSNAVN